MRPGPPPRGAGGRPRRQRATAGPEAYQQRPGVDGASSLRASVPGSIIRRSSRAERDARRPRSSSSASTRVRLDVGRDRRRRRRRPCPAARRRRQRPPPAPPARRRRTTGVVPTTLASAPIRRWSKRPVKGTRLSLRAGLLDGRRLVLTRPNSGRKTASREALRERPPSRRARWTGRPRVRASLLPSCWRLVGVLLASRPRVAPSLSYSAGAIMYHHPIVVLAIAEERIAEERRAADRRAARRRGERLRSWSKKRTGSSAPHPTPQQRPSYPLTSTDTACRPKSVADVQRSEDVFGQAVTDMAASPPATRRRAVRAFESGYEMGEQESGSSSGSDLEGLSARALFPRADRGRLTPERG